MTWAYRWVTNLQAGVISQLTVVLSMLLGVAILGDRLTVGKPREILTLAGVVGRGPVGGDTESGGVDAEALPSRPERRGRALRPPPLFSKPWTSRPRPWTRHPAAGKSS